MRANQAAKDPLRNATPGEPAWVRVERAHQRLLDLPLTELGAADEPSRVREPLDVLPELLLEHFAHEEEPGELFDELRGIRPAIGPELEALQRQHQEMLRTVETLKRQARDTDSLVTNAKPEAHFARIRQETAALLERVQGHALAENQLIADTWYTDEGGSG
jgi:hypothetical protein